MLNFDSGYQVCGLLWIPIALMTVVIAAVASPISARVCVLKIDLNSPGSGVHIRRIIMPPGDPCTCTVVRRSGHCPYTAQIQGQDPLVYIDMLPVVTAETVRNQFHCTANQTESTSEVSKVGSESTPKVTTIAQEVDSTIITSSAPGATTDVTIYSEPTVTAADCQEILDAGFTTSGVYTIRNDGQTTQVYCSIESEASFIVFQRRINGSVSFDRTWQEYAEGFGNLTGEFWLGNEKLYDLTRNGSWELVITLRAFDGGEAYVRYRDFKISSARNFYRLQVDFIDGNAGDSLVKLLLMPFTTVDKYDSHESEILSCGQVAHSGWWFRRCNRIDSNLNGVYHSSPVVDDYQGIQWVSWKGSRYSLKGCDMKMRRILNE
ncbi:microfibril-associated glycoprotein 4-like [Acanthaster planci]|uniref:Microfibril-associated glycoprotein 4-like n=1 Tax=Acanthaster planci TaxID=133434 RepID=A0A8B7XKV9_ACAPL|nr:microfibril-associated glycoprotein 4-like [Acanthaster planci]XP_022081443.1 microfibril-associated glycoprotein 4-like [Acanthaster planci]